VLDRAWFARFFTGLQGRNRGLTMSAQVPRTPYTRAVAGYDEAHERDLVEALTKALFEASRVTNIPCVVTRTGEAASALLTMLATVLAMSPATVRSPTALRRTIDELGKRLRRRVAAAENDHEMQNFMRRCFRSGGVGGNA
jgi:hypothetical protein